MTCYVHSIDIISCKFAVFSIFAYNFTNNRIIFKSAVNCGIVRFIMDLVCHTYICTMVNRSNCVVIAFAIVILNHFNCCNLFTIVYNRATL